MTNITQSTDTPTGYECPVCHVFLDNSSKLFIRCSEPACPEKSGKSVLSILEDTQSAPPASGPEAAPVATVIPYTDEDDNPDMDVQPAQDVSALVEALKPFAAIAECDIGDSESDEDLYRPMSERHRRAPLITVGNLRRARDAISAQPATGEG